MANETEKIPATVTRKDGMIERGGRKQTVKTGSWKPTRFFNRNYVLIWQGQFVSRLGTQLSSVVMLLWIKQATDSASLMGLMAMLTNVPVILLGIIGGTFADRYSRRNIISFSDALSGLALLALAVLFTIYSDEPLVMAACIIGTTVFVAVADSFSSPAIVAAVPDLVPKGELARANSLGQLSAQIAFFLGQGLGGVFFRLLGAPVVAWVNGISFLWAAASESVAVIPQKLPQKTLGWKKRWAEFKADTLEGFRYILHVRGLKYLIAGSAGSSLLAAPVLILIPFFVTDVLKVPVDWVGFLSAGYGVGSLGGYLIAGSVKVSGARRSRVVVVLMLVEAVNYGLLGLMTHPVAALCVAFAEGALSGFVMVQIMTILQITTPSERRGRVFAVTGTISSSLAPLGMGLGGLVFDAIGQSIPVMYIGCSVLMVAMVTLLASRREFREYLGFEQSPEHELPEQQPTTRGML
jgi:DHA3 family macrolide efflux protein-like MFS transporter